MMYVPLSTISVDAVSLTVEISARIEQYAIRLEQNDKLRSRKTDRVRTICSSLAVESNTLSKDEVKDIIDGKIVVVSLCQIQEVKNAVRTYELCSGLNPFNVKDLLKAHNTMMMALTDDAGKLRSGRFRPTHRFYASRDLEHSERTLRNSDHPSQGKRSSG